MNTDLLIDTFSQIFIHSREGIIILNSDYTIEAINNTACDFLAANSIAIVGKKFNNLYPEFFVQGKLIEGVVKVKNKTKIQTRLLKLSSERFNSCQVLFFELAPQEEKWKLLANVIDSIDDAVMVCDSSGRLIVYNDANARMDGLLREQVLGKPVTNVYKLTEAQSLLHQTIKDRKPIINKHQSYTTFEGRKLDIMCSTFPLFENQKIIGAVSIMKDYSRIKELSDRVLGLQEQLYGKVNTPVAKKANLNPRYTFEDLIGTSNNIQQAITWARKAAKTSSHVLIYGETGTGKELFAQSIHNASSRAANPFIAVNCAAIPENLLEGILFGTVKGAYTGSIDRPGLFEQANRGTLLLDEMNSMSFALQSKLLRVLQEGTIRRLGDISEIPVDVRIISNINKEPNKAIMDKELREDLYYRLSAVYLEIPPLRSRVGDIPLLGKIFVDMYNRSLGRSIAYLSSEAMNMFGHHNWPGNVRELQHAIESAMNIVDDHETVLLPAHFPASIRSKITSNSSDITSNMSVLLPEGPLEQVLEQLELFVVSRALKKNKWNVSRTAKQLEIKRQSLQYRIRKYGLKQCQ